VSRPTHKESPVHNTNYGPVSVSELARDGSSLVREVENGARFLITRDGRVVAELVEAHDDDGAVPVSELSRGNPSALLERVLEGETVRIRRHGSVVALLRPVSDEATAAVFGRVGELPNLEQPMDLRPD
jgi:antitoxin (DNA-binding transcriptional repressor) of toxin-antitoxin stability system